MANPRPSIPNQPKVRAAVDRGVAAGKYPWAIYLPGEEARCPARLRSPEGADLFCAGYLGTGGPESATWVREYEERRFNERRQTSRAKVPCPNCRRPLEMEMKNAATSAA